MLPSLGHDRAPRSTTRALRRRTSLVSTLRRETACATVGLRVRRRSAARTFVAPAPLGWHRIQAASALAPRGWSAPLVPHFPTLAAGLADGAERAPSERRLAVSWPRLGLRGQGRALSLLSRAARATRFVPVGRFGTPRARARQALEQRPPGQRRDRSASTGGRPVNALDDRACSCAISYPADWAT